MTFGLWPVASSCGIFFPMAGQLTDRLHRMTCIAALITWVAFGWPVIQNFITGGTIRGGPVLPLWFIPFAAFGAAMLGAMSLKRRAELLWSALCIQLGAVLAMAIILPWAGMSQFLTIIAWQAAMATTPARALGWVGMQTAAIISALAQALNPDLCWVIGKSFALQLLLVFTAQALRREAETARALACTNQELLSAQVIVANTVRDAERLRISRELHDAWGHELTALGLQLEIASHVTPEGKAKLHVLHARRLAGALLGKVRDVVSTLREADRCDLKNALEVLAHKVPVPSIHVAMAPGVEVSPDQAHALIRCAQEAVTNAIRHANASNLWLQVTAHEDGVRLVVHDDGNASMVAPSTGSGLVGMRERVECLGGRLAVRTDAGHGFTVDAWLPIRTPQPA